MNERKLLITKLICLIILLVMIVWACIKVNLIQTNLGFPFSGNSISSSDEIETITHEYLNIDRFKINLIDENVHFAYHEGSSIKLTYIGKDGDILQLNQRGSTLEISKQNSWEIFNFNFNSNPGELVILLPKDTANYSYIIHLVSGSIQLDTAGIYGDLNTVSGNFDVNGNFNSLDFETVSGDITSNGVASKIEANTISGKTSVILAAAGEFDGDSISGNYYIKVLGDAYAIELDTLSGKLNKSFNIQYHRLYSIDVSTVSGDLNITQD